MADLNKMIDRATLWAHLFQNILFFTTLERERILQLMSGRGVLAKSKRDEITTMTQDALLRTPNQTKRLEKKQTSLRLVS